LNLSVSAHDPQAHAHNFEGLTKRSSVLGHYDLHPEKFITGDDLIRMGKKAGK
jgi:hypothetical protein